MEFAPAPPAGFRGAKNPVAKPLNPLQPRNTTRQPTSPAQSAGENSSQRRSTSEERAAAEEPAISFSGTMGASFGHDSNPDEEEGGRDQFIDRYDAQITGEIENKTVEAEFQFKGTFFNARELDPPVRWIYETSLEGKVRATQRSNLVFSLAREHDAESTTESAENRGSIGTETKLGQAVWSIRGTIKNEDQITGDFGDEEREGFGYFKTGVESRLVLHNDAKLSPFAALRLSRTHHPNQTGAAVNRNAEDLTVVAGLILKPAKDLEAEIGVRYNARDFRRDGGSADHLFVQASLNYKPSDHLTVSASVNREFKETSTEDALVDDETTYELSAAWKPDEKWKIDASASYTKTKRLEAVETEEEFETEIKLSYFLRSALKIFGVVGFLDNTTKSTDGSRSRYDRLIVRAGMEAEF